MTTNTDPVRVINVGALKVPVGEAAKHARDAAGRLVERHRIFQAATGGKGDPFDSEVANLLFAGAAALDALASAPQQPAGVDGDEVRRVAQHIGTAADYIDKAYPDANMLDRGPILRNMRRWHERLTAALAAQQPVGVDEAMVERAVRAAERFSDEGQITFEGMRAALAAAIAAQQQGGA